MTDHGIAERIEQVVENGRRAQELVAIVAPGYALESRGREGGTANPHRDRWCVAAIGDGRWRMYSVNLQTSEVALVCDDDLAERLDWEAEADEDDVTP